MKLMKLGNFALAFVLLLALPASACGESVLPPDGGTVEVTGVELDRAALTLDIGQSETLTCMVLPADATDKTEKWISSAPGVASVSGGTVTAVSEGKATIRVTVGGKSADCAVTVVDPAKTHVAPVSVSLSPKTLSLTVGSAEKLTATVLPENATDRALTWESSQASVATVDGGIVSALSAGTAVITARTAGGLSDTCFVTVTSSGGGEVVPPADEDELWVGKIDSLEGRSTPFIMGMDASAVPSLEKARETEGLTYKNFDGESEDVFQILKENGITDIRVRIWNDPKDANGNWYGGGNCDTDNAVEIAKRCKDADLGMIVNFHYSDFWADPGKQTIPKAWQGHSTEQVAKDIYEFTKDSLTKIKETGVRITMVQIGNETTSGIAGTTDWAKNGAIICNYIQNGSKAVREVTGPVANGGAKVAVHFTNPEAGNYLSFAGYLNTNKVDYDVFGSSYYPYWHGTLLNFGNQLAGVHNTYNKEVMCLETSYAFTRDDADGYGNTGLTTITQPTTVQGQSNAIRDVIQTVSDLGDWGLGICYWEGTWIAASTSKNSADNVKLCTQYGCGWASAAAKGYDSSVTNNGGCVIDNQAFWLSDGTPLESLKVFKLVHEGTDVSIKADYLEAQDGYYTVNEGKISLPATVNIVLNTGSRLSVPAIWNVEESTLERYIHSVGNYTVVGTTRYGGECTFTIWVQNPNLMDDGSFENCKAYGQTDYLIQSTGLGNWKMGDYTKTTNLQLYVSNDSGNARMGKYSFHFWDDAPVKFKLYQQFVSSDLSEYGDGKYGASFEIMGGDGVDMEIYAYVTLTYASGESKTFKGNEVTLSGWLDWKKTIVSGVEIDGSVARIEVGISVKADVTGNGPWGNIDNAQFYFEN